MSGWPRPLGIDKNITQYIYYIKIYNRRFVNAFFYPSDTYVQRTNISIFLTMKNIRFVHALDTNIG